MSIELNAELRTDTGKGASRRLRRQGKVPAIIYGAGRPPRALVFDHNRVIQQLENESFYSSVLSVKVGDKEQAVILKDLQRHPAKPFIQHFDLLRVAGGDRIKMHVPLHFTGEKDAPGVKAGGQVSHHLMDVEVVCQAQDLPEFIEVDLSAMGPGDSVMLSELALPEGVTIPALAIDPEENDAAVANAIYISESQGTGAAAAAEAEAAAADELAEAGAPAVEEEVGEEDAEADAEAESKSKDED